MATYTYCSGPRSAEKAAAEGIGHKRTVDWRKDLVSGPMPFLAGVIRELAPGRG